MVAAAILLCANHGGAGAPAQDQPTLEDIIEMRSIGGLSLSPDGRQLAFRVLTPSVRANSVRGQWYVVRIDVSGAPSPWGKPSAPILMPMADIMEEEGPVWAPDARSFFIRALDQDEIQVHRLGPGGRDRAITHERSDIVSIAMEPSGEALTFKLRNDRAVIDQAVAAEEAQGVHIDGTVSLEGSRLTRNLTIGTRISTMRYFAPGAAEELGAGPVRTGRIALPRHGSPSATPFSSLVPRSDSLDPARSADQQRWIEAPGGDIAVAIRDIAPLTASAYTRRAEVVAKLPDGTVRTCELPVCRDYAASIRQVVPIAETGEIAILHEADFSARTGIFAWNPASDRLRIVAAPKGSLDGGHSTGASRCARLDHRLFCVRAAPIVPPELVSIDLITGDIVVLATPNQRLANLAHRPARFLEWRGTDGESANGILVLPTGARPPYPLVISSYRCRGYLQGSTGLLAPEQILAQRGFAALCVNHNNAAGRVGDVRPLGPHRAAIASYRAIIDRLSRDGLIDPDHVGLAGHSFTSMVGAYAIAHDDLFATAVIGTGITIDPATFLFTQAPTDSWRKGLLDVLQMPDPMDDLEAWKAISPALNARRIDAPLLIQPPENEYLLGLQLYASINQAGGTADMYVYPNEGHTIGRQPIHQYWRAQRAIDWFGFWLQGQVNDVPETMSQFAHWIRLRDRRGAPAAHLGE